MCFWHIVLLELACLQSSEIANEERKTIDFYHDFAEIPKVSCLIPVPEVLIKNLKILFVESHLMRK